jgi:hypothetical protein
MQLAVLNDTNAWYWVNVPYLMQELQGRYRQSSASVHYSGYFLSINTDMSVAIIEQCMDCVGVSLTYRNFWVTFEGA